MLQFCFSDKSPPLAPHSRVAERTQTSNCSWIKGRCGPFPLTEQVSSPCGPWNQFVKRIFIAWQQPDKWRLFAQLRVQALGLREYTLVAFTFIDINPVKIRVYLGICDNVPMINSKLYFKWDLKQCRGKRQKNCDYCFAPNFTTDL